MNLDKLLLLVLLSLTYLLDQFSTFIYHLARVKNLLIGYVWLLLREYMPRYYYSNTNKVPKHVAFSISDYYEVDNSESSVSVIDLARLVYWCGKHGVETVTIYDWRGVIALPSSTTTIADTVWRKIDSDPDLDDLKFVVNGVPYCKLDDCNKRITHTRNGSGKLSESMARTLNLITLDWRAGRRSVVDASRSLANMVKQENVEVNGGSQLNSAFALNDYLARERGVTAADLLIEFGGDSVGDSTCGYPPLALRVAEIVRVPKHRNVNECTLLECLRRFSKRHIALMVSYFGWDYHGLVRQETVEATIEGVLQKALLKTKLIESVETAGFSRCGRTDKGVSAFRQVLSLDVRSLAKEGDGVFIPEGYSCERSQANTRDEFNYTAMLNRSLPRDIQVLAWAPVPQEFSARHDCRQRTYKYFFPRSDLDIESMRLAGQLLIGTHDFRNFCKLDLSRNCVRETIRNITIATIDAADPQHSRDDPYSMYVLTISGSGFLWHQIRNIVTILILIGQGKESSDVIKTLLDVNACPRKPQYTPALETPLVLYDSLYENLQWRWDQECTQHTIRRMQQDWVELAAKAQMVKSMCEDLSKEAACRDSSFVPSVDLHALLPGGRQRKHIPLLKRPTAMSLEEHQAKCELRRVQKERENSQSPMSDGKSDSSALEKSHSPVLERRHSGASEQSHSDVLESSSQ